MRRALARSGLLLGMGIGALAQPRADLGLGALWLGTVVFLVWTRRRVWLARLGIACAMAAVWVWSARSHYVYNQPYLVLAGMNVFPLFAWGTGLFAVYAIHHHVAEARGLKSVWVRLALFCLAYWPLLIAFEALGYNVFRIHDVAVAGNPPLPFGRCMHMPTWMRTAYFLMGPLFFALCEAAESIVLRLRGAREECLEPSPET
jgi:hypothetical protein